MEYWVTNPTIFSKYDLIYLAEMCRFYCWVEAQSDLREFVFIAIQCFSSQVKSQPLVRSEQFQETEVS